MYTGVFHGEQTAKQLSGPLTLLQILNRCSQNVHLQYVLGKAREKGMLQVHIIGANDTLEPAMAWAGVLGGWNLKSTKSKQRAPETVVGMAKLAAEASLLKTQWELPPAFADLNLHLVFNGFERRESRFGKGIFDSSHCHRTTWLAGATAGRDDRVRIECLVGKYGSEAVVGLGKSIPDLAVALSPGFGLEPENWKDSINYLLDHEVPTLVTGAVLNKHRSATAVHAAQLRRMMRSEQPRPENQLSEHQCDGPHGLVESSISNARLLRRLGANIVEGYRNPFAFTSDQDATVLKNGEALLFVGRQSTPSSSTLAETLAKPAPQDLVHEELVGMLSDCKDFVLAEPDFPGRECFDDAEKRLTATSDFTCGGQIDCKHGKILSIFSNFIQGQPCLRKCEEYLQRLPRL